MASRRLTPDELAEAQQVFEAAIRYRPIKISESSSIALVVGLVGSIFDGGGRRPVANAMTIGYSIRFSRALKTDKSYDEQARIGDMAWLIHELTHVWQYEDSGWIYLPQAVSERVLQGSKAYQYSPKSGLLNRGKDLEQLWDEGIRFRDLHREQQGNVVRDYFVALKTDIDTSGWEPFIHDMRIQP